MVIKFTKEIAEITAVSVLRIFFESEKGTVVEPFKINSLSAGEKSPSGPTKTVVVSPSLKSFFSKL